MYICVYTYIESFPSSGCLYFECMEVKLQSWPFSPFDFTKPVWLVHVLATRFWPKQISGVSQRVVISTLFAKGQKGFLKKKS